MRRTTLLALLAALTVAGWIALFEREGGNTEQGIPVFGLGQEQRWDPAHTKILTPTVHADMSAVAILAQAI